MKKTLLFVLVSAVLSFSSVLAGPVSIHLANTVAKYFYFSKAHALFADNINQVQPELIKTFTDENGTLGYVYSFGNIPGWVMISAEDGFSPVIGYSTEGEFATLEEDQPCGFKAMMQDYGNRIQEIRQNQEGASKEIKALWNKYKVYTPGVTDAPSTIVGPLTTTLWDQGCHYDESCPATGGIHPSGPCNHVYTGCVATAMAQVLKYWNFPAHGTGSNSYTDPDDWNEAHTVIVDPSYGTLSRTFNTWYNWSNMPDVPVNSSTGIPDLMVDCGISVNMNYSYQGSSSWGYGDPIVANNLKNHFYFQSTAADVRKEDYTDLNWENMMKNELNNYRVIDYGNHNHSWVIDGYDDGGGSTLFHMNWGWSGSSNGYFLLSSSSVGSGQEAVIGIVPIYQPPAPPTNVSASQGIFNERVRVTWRWASNANYYRVFRSTTNDYLASSDVTGWVSGLEFNDYNTIPGQNYYYWVQSSSNSSGTDQSGFSLVAMGYLAPPSTLSSGSSEYVISTPEYFNFTSNGWWDVVGVQPEFNEDNWDIYMYSDTYFTSPLLAVSENGPGIVDFVLVDGNHTAQIPRGIKVNRYNGVDMAHAEFDGGTDQLYVGANNGLYWESDRVVKAWDVYLTPGTYRISLGVTYGYFDPGIALYGSSGGNYYQTRGAALSMADANSWGQDESSLVTIYTSDWYGLVVWSNTNGYDGEFNITIEQAGTWTGAVNSDWFTPGNWSAGVVPDGTLDVTIPNVTNKPWIWGGEGWDAHCRNLTLQNGPGNYLRIYDSRLFIAGDAHFYDQLMMDYNDAAAQLWVTGSVFWEEGSTALISDAIGIRVYGHMDFLSGSNVQMYGGAVMFMGNTDSYLHIYQAGTILHRLGSYKTSPSYAIFSTYSTQPLVVESDFYTHPDATFYLNADLTTFIGGNVYDNGFLACPAGKVVLNGNSQLVSLNNNSYFKDLEVNSTYYVSLNANAQVMGDLILTAGVFSTNVYTLLVGGDWINTEDPGGFSGTDGKVVFNGGDYHQYCSSENFGPLEINKASGGALRIMGSEVICSSYDWTAGAVDVLWGSFTANALVDNGIAGNYYVNAGGTINLSNYDGWVDLNGNVNIYGGNFNVYGGISDSYWPYAANASLTMTFGVLDFVNTGILMFNSSPYSLTINQTGGTIRTVGNFYAQRTEFQPAGGTVELYGGNDVAVDCYNGGFFNHLIINKSNAVAPMLPVAGIQNQLILKGGLLIQNGTLATNNIPVSVGGDWTNMVGNDGFQEAM
ncbi:MAG: C10 family peptidase, partial [Bacteroidetes bacterium]|nr:C10 family peptidase [Bacteroidota bacterium]